MKVELQCGDTITIPEGCKAIVKDGSVIIEKEFKNGDVLHSVHDDLMLIYKESCSSERFSSHFNMIHNYNNGWNTRSFRLATEEEKQLLFDKMKDKGLKRNAEEKRVEKIRWRAEMDKRYFIVGCSGNMGICTENDYRSDNSLYEFGNYFRTKEQVKKVARRIREALR